MSEYEEPTEEQLQAARDFTPGREEDNLDVPEEETPVPPETSEEALASTPVREEDEVVAEKAVEETATTTKESEDEAVGSEGAGTDSPDHNPG